MNSMYRDSLGTNGEQFFFVPLTQAEATRAVEAVESMVPRPRELRRSGRKTQWLPTEDDDSTIEQLRRHLRQIELGLATDSGHTGRWIEDRLEWFAGYLEQAGETELAQRFRSGRMHAVWVNHKRKPGGGYWRPAKYTPATPSLVRYALRRHEVRTRHDHAREGVHCRDMGGGSGARVSVDIDYPEQRHTMAEHITQALTAERFVFTRGGDDIPWWKVTSRWS